MSLQLTHRHLHFYEPMCNQRPWEAYPPCQPCDYIGLWFFWMIQVVLTISGNTYTHTYTRDCSVCPCVCVWVVIDGSALPQVSFEDRQGGCTFHGLRFNAIHVYHETVKQNILWFQYTVSIYECFTHTCKSLKTVQQNLLRQEYLLYSYDYPTYRDQL